jgi:hypothetical protein
MYFLKKKKNIQFKDMEQVSFNKILLLEIVKISFFKRIYVMDKIMVKKK